MVFQAVFGWHDYGSLKMSKARFSEAENGASAAHRHGVSCRNIVGCVALPRTRLSIPLLTACVPMAHTLRATFVFRLPLRIKLLLQPARFRLRLSRRFGTRLG